MITQTLFQRDCCFTTQHVHDLLAIADAERRAHQDIEPRTTETSGSARNRLLVGPAALLVAMAAVLLR